MLMRLSASRASFKCPLPLLYMSQALQALCIHWLLIVGLRHEADRGARWGQDARMGVLFDTFPPVLQLHLKRFDYDYDRDMQIKARCLA